MSISSFQRCIIIKAKRTELKNNLRRREEEDRFIVPRNRMKLKGKI